MMKFTNKIIIDINERYKTLWALNHLTALASWDMQTYMPEDGINARSEALSKISVLGQKLFLDKEFVNLIGLAEKEKNLNEYETAIVRVLKRELKYYQKLPPKFIEEFSRVTSKAHLAWKEAKEKKNFSIFEPYLEKIVELSRKKAEYLGYKKHPYDALLDLYEEGLTTDEVQRYFDSIKNPLISLVKKIKNSKNYKSEVQLEKEKYDAKKMSAFDQKLLKLIHGNANNLRIDFAPHPFSISLGEGDNRITTRHFGIDFAEAFGSVVHEFGHALYEMQIAKELKMTPLGSLSSLTIHESQSRFWEKMIGLSKEFILLVQKDISELSPGMKKYSVDDIYRYFNLVKPSLIRTGADEVTYHLHVLIRFEIEKALIEGTIKVKDLPKIWNEKYGQYLGISPKNDADGVLQDIQWSGGDIGYFPTYSLGTALSAIWKNQMEKDIGIISDLLKKTDGIGKIKKWLGENIHQYGSTYTYNQLAKKISGEEFSSKPLLDYLNKKYSKIY